MYGFCHSFSLFLSHEGVMVEGRRGADGPEGGVCPIPPPPGQQWAGATLHQHKWLRQSEKVAGARRHLRPPLLHRSSQAPLGSPGMLIRGLDSVESRAQWRKRKACRGKEVHASFTCIYTHTTGAHHEDHTLACTTDKLPVEGATKPLYCVCSEEYKGIMIRKICGKLIISASHFSLKPHSLLKGADNLDK